MIHKNGVPVPLFKLSKAVNIIIILTRGYTPLYSQMCWVIDIKNPPTWIVVVYLHLRHNLNTTMIRKVFEIAKKTPDFSEVSNKKDLIYVIYSISYPRKKVQPAANVITSAQRQSQMNSIIRNTHGTIHQPIQAIAIPRRRNIPQSTPPITQSFWLFDNSRKADFMPSWFILLFIRS